MLLALARSVAVSWGTFFIADSTAQLIERCSKSASARDWTHPQRSFEDVTSEYSAARGLRYAFVGGMVMAPIFHTWYHVIERVMPGRQLWYQKLLLECFTIAPVYLACNMTAATSLKTLGIFENIDFHASCTKAHVGQAFHQVRSDVQSKLSADFLRLYFGALTVVPMYQAVNYRFIPLQYRMYWLNACQLLFNIWVSHRVATDARPSVKRASRNPNHLIAVF